MQKNHVFIALLCLGAGVAGAYGLNKYNDKTRIEAYRSGVSVTLTDLAAYNCKKDEGGMLVAYTTCMGREREQLEKHLYIGQNVARTLSEEDMHLLGQP